LYSNTQNRSSEQQSEIVMMKLSSMAMTAGVALLMCLNATPLEAQGQGRQGGQGGQGRGNFDPDQMRQRMMDGVREQFEVKDDAEWQVIEPRVSKVWETRREVGAAGAGGMRMMARRPQGDNADGGQGGPGGQAARRFGGEPSAEEAALQKAIDSNASTAELKSAIAKYRESRKQREAALEKAQQELKEVLNVKQEAVALSMGLIN
jgi:hypothetical protein